MLDTFDWRMVTASPMEGFLLATAEALKALAVVFNKVCWVFSLDTSLESIVLK